MENSVREEKDPYELGGKLLKVMKQERINNQPNTLQPKLKATLLFDLNEINRIRRYSGEDEFFMKLGKELYSGFEIRR